MEKVRKVLKVIKDTLIKGCIVFFVISVVFNVSIYSELQSQLSSNFSDKETLISNYSEQEKELETQIEEQKQENGEDYPILTMLQYVQYINGAGTIIYMNIELAICSLAVGILIQFFNFINKKLKDLVNKIKTKKGKKKDEQ